MCLVCLVSLQLLSMQMDDLLPNIMIGDYYGTTSVSSLNNSLFIIIKCARYIHAVHYALY